MSEQSDIQAALEQLNNPLSSDEDGSGNPVPSSSVMEVVSISQIPTAGGRVIYALKRLGITMLEHPWWTVLGFATAVACAKTMCVYAGWTIILMLIITALHEPNDKLPD